MTAKWLNDRTVFVGLGAYWWNAAWSSVGQACNWYGKHPYLDRDAKWQWWE